MTSGAKASSQTCGSTRRRQHCCEPALPALLQPPPATTWHLNRNKLRAGNCPQAGRMFCISYKYLECCLLTRGRHSTHVPTTTPALLRGLQAGAGLVGHGLVQGKRAVAFPNLLHPVVSLQASLFPLCYTSATNCSHLALVGGAEVCVPVLEHPHSLLLPSLGSHGYKAQGTVWGAPGRWLWAGH